MPKEAILWRYFPARDTFKLNLFLHGGLWCARLDTFSPGLDETLEGRLPERNVGLLAKLMLKEQTAQVKEQYRRAALRCYASCWTMGVANPDWCSSFCGDGDGLAIRTNVAAMKSVITKYKGCGEGPVYFGKVRYINHALDEIPEANPLEAAFSVRDIYRRENEARVLVHSYPKEMCLYDAGLVRCVPKCCTATGQREFVGARAEGKAIVLPIGCGFIKQIRIGPRVSEACALEIEAKVKEHGFSKILFRDFA